MLEDTMAVIFPHTVVDIKTREKDKDRIRNTESYS